MDIKETMADRVVRWFDPVKAVKRLQARAYLSAAGGAAFTGASTERRSLSGWKTTANSADADLIPDLGELRNRSRDLRRNNPIAAGAIATAVTNIVGTGLSLQSKIDAEALGMSPEQAREWQRITEREWRQWCESTSCDITRHQDFYGLQELVLRSVLEAGDCFTLLPFVPGLDSPYSLRVQVIEADRVTNKDKEKDTAMLVGGVQLDKYGAPVAYHVARTHPGAIGQSGKLEWDIIPAFGKQTGRRNMLHHFRRERPGQNRGIPYLATAIEPLKQLSRYSEAELMAAVISAMFTVFVKSPSGNGLDAANPTGMGAETGAGDGDNDVKMGNGAIVDLGPGEEIQIADPKRPNINFDPFFLSMVRQIGIALEIPYEVLIKHYSASFSASRAAMVELWKFVRNRREWLIQSFCEPVYEAWMEEAVALGRIDAPGFFEDPAIRRAWLGAAWHGDAMPQINPVVEAQAAKERLALGITTHTREAAALTGADWWSEHELFAQELEERRAKNTIVDLQPEAFGDTSKQPQPGQQPQNPNTPPGEEAPQEPTKKPGEEEEETP